QAACGSQDVCRSGRHRHREHAAAQRVARVATAADRHRGRAQGHQQFARWLEPVFQAMLANATRLCEAKFGIMFRYDGDAFRITGIEGMAADYGGVVRREAVRPGPETILARMTRTKQVAQIEDARAERGYAEHDPMFVAAVERGGVRTILGVPMLKDNELVG